MSTLRTERPPRRPCDAVVEIYWGSEILHARAKDMSVSGLFLEIVTPLWVGAEFSAKLILSCPLEITCTVRRVVPNRGMGVQISFNDPDSIQRFASELKRLS